MFPHVPFIFHPLQSQPFLGPQNRSRHLRFLKAARWSRDVLRKPGQDEPQGPKNTWGPLLSEIPMTDPWDDFLFT